jgi:hypothetical protein
MSNETATEIGAVGAVLILLAFLNLFPTGAFILSLVFWAAGAFTIKIAVDESKLGLYG